MPAAVFLVLAVVLISGGAASAACLPDMATVELRGSITPFHSSVKGDKTTYYRLDTDQPFCVKDDNFDTIPKPTRQAFISATGTIQELVSRNAGKTVTMAGQVTETRVVAQ